MSFCFMIQSKNDMVKYVKDYFTANFDTRKRFHVDYYCYDNIYVFSYGFSGILVEGEDKKGENKNNCVSFFLSDIAVGIFQLLIKNHIGFNFAFVNLRHKEDEEMIFRDIIKNPKVKYKLNAPYCIIER
ncbi:hypothetical protein WDM69_08375 [Moraxella lincolnii]|uniref:Uncharacterized protein n=2 Tax=Lwoffella lincolnii TaxID=90241 RepID=A0A1T0CBJ5_9GAMM|nr:hypothetical protein B0682_08210 [Moraxella lincolnii]